ncbi:MAG: hypothetical protein ACO22K_03790 [Woeseiaceae bacterium]
MTSGRAIAVIEFERNEQSDTTICAAGGIRTGGFSITLSLKASLRTADG